MSNQDNSEWLNSLLEAEKESPYFYKRLNSILSKESLFLRSLAFAASIFMLIVFLWGLSLLDFIPGFSDVAQNFMTWLEYKYLWLKSTVFEIYIALTHAEWF